MVGLLSYFGGPFQGEAAVGGVECRDRDGEGDLGLGQKREVGAPSTAMAAASYGGRFVHQFYLLFKFNLRIVFE